MRNRAIWGILLTALAAPAFADTLITIERPELYDLQVRGFELPRQAEIEIDAVGLRADDDDGWLERWWRGRHAEDRMSVYAWILDAQTRQPVWFMDPRDTSSVSSTLRGIEESVTLAAGRYELYFYSGHGWVADLEQRREEQDDRWWKRIWSERGIDVDDLLDDLEDCYVKLRSSDMRREELRTFEVTGDLGGAIVQHNRVGDSELRATGLQLDREMGLRLYGLFERPDNGGHEAADYGWIVDAETREVVWDPRRAGARHGGGGDKNWVVEDEIRLEPGRYMLYYGTDDSHSFERFNANPPYDPFNWGLTLLPGEGFSAGAFRTFEPEAAEPMFDLTRAGDGEILEQAFRLERDGAVRVLALGEYVEGQDGFADRAWIVEAGTGRVVWEMTSRNTRGAGGADKNRMFDGLVELSAGQYVVYYVSDGSHSFDDWNAATPFMPEAWGVSVWPGPQLREDDVRPLRMAEVEQADDVVVRLVHAGDSERLRQRFTLEDEAEISIYALGEGQSGRMYDYGYIVDDRTGRTVWEMTYDRTDHAGGARKNRRLTEELSIGPGTYEAVYVTDGSHSFEGWNASSPSDPMNWGLTIRVREH